MNQIYTSIADHPCDPPRKRQLVPHKSIDLSTDATSLSSNGCLADSWQSRSRAIIQHQDFHTEFFKDFGVAILLIEEYDRFEAIPVDETDKIVQACGRTTTAGSLNIEYSALHAPDVLPVRTF